MRTDGPGFDAPWGYDHDEDEASGPSVLEAFIEHAPESEPADSWDDSEPSGRDQDDSIETLLVTVANPAGTVTTTVLLTGQVLKVELSPQVTAMTESELAEEITYISMLARKQAQAAQHAVVADCLRQLGNDATTTRAFLEYDIGLPSPETVLDEKAREFASRYADRG